MASSEILGPSSAFAVIVMHSYYFLRFTCSPKIGILNEKSRINLIFLSPASPFLVPLLPLSTFASYHVTQIFLKPIVALFLLLLRFV